MDLKRHIIFVILTLCVTIAVFELIHIDLMLQTVFRDHGQWLLGRDEQPWRFIFYDGIKKVFGLVAIVLLLAMLFFKHRISFIAANKEGWWVLLLTMIVVPLITNFLKWYTDIPCPRDLLAFGGDAPYVTLSMHFPAWFSHESSMRCYPAGHASGGFALMALYFVFKQQKWQRLGLIFGITIGWTIGIYKMAIGDHFFSHTLVSMMLAWLITCCLAYLFKARSAD